MMHNYKLPRVSESPIYLQYPDSRKIFAVGPALTIRDKAGPILYKDPATMNSEPSSRIIDRSFRLKITLLIL